MLNKMCSTLLLVLMINLTGVSVAFAGNSSAADASSAIAAKGEKTSFVEKEGDAKLSKKQRKINKRADEIQEGVRKLGVSKDSKVQVKLRDKTKVQGYISDIGEKDFTVTDQMGQSHVIDYKNAKQIKGNNLHAGVWIGIGAGIGLLVIWLIIENLD